MTTAQTGTGNNSGEATDQGSEAQDQHAMQMILANNADAAPLAAVTDQSGTGGPSADDNAANLLASIRLHDGQTVARFFIEQAFRDGKEDAYITYMAALYLRTSQSEYIPDWVMERLSAEARVVREAPLNAEEEACLDELEERYWRATT